MGAQQEGIQGIPRAAHMCKGCRGPRDCSWYALNDALSSPVSARSPSIALRARAGTLGVLLWGCLTGQAGRPVQGVLLSSCSASTRPFGKAAAAFVRNMYSAGRLTCGFPVVVLVVSACSGLLRPKTLTLLVCRKHWL